MKIHKILNNNVIVTFDDKGNEKIVMGCGLAFKKKVGDIIDNNLVDKTFYMSNKEISSNFQELLRDIPIEYVELSEEIITRSKTWLGRKLNDSIYISIVDHIYSSIVRFKDGIVVKNALLWEIKRFYPEEFKVGRKALEIIEEQTNVKLPDDEAGFIALHFVNAQMDEKIEDMVEITQLIQDISNIVKYSFNITFNEESVYYYRFISHLKFFSQRLIHKKTYEGNQEDDLLDVIKKKYNSAYLCVSKITKFVNEKYDYNLSNEEQLYLTIHIQRVVYKSDTNE